MASPLPKSSIGDIIRPAWTDRSQLTTRAICTYTVCLFRKSNRRMSRPILLTLSDW